MAHGTNTDTGKPSGVGKQENGTGIPSKISDEKMQQDQDITDRYTNDDNGIADSVHVGHPNRNTGKEDATGIGGYRE